MVKRRSGEAAKRVLVCAVVMLGVTSLGSDPASASGDGQACSVNPAGVQSYENVQGQWSWGVRATFQRKMGFKECPQDSTENYVYTCVGINDPSSSGWIRSAFGSGERSLQAFDWFGDCYVATWKRSSTHAADVKWQCSTQPTIELSVLNIVDPMCSTSGQSTPCLVAYHGLIPVLVSKNVDQWVEWGADQRYMYGSRGSYISNDIGGEYTNKMALQALRVMNAGGWVANPWALTLNDNNSGEWASDPLFLNSFTTYDH